MWPWLRRRAASEERRQCVEHTVNSPSNRDAALALWPPQRGPTIGTIERGLDGAIDLLCNVWIPRGVKSARRLRRCFRLHVLLNVCFFDVWPPCSPWKQPCNRSASDVMHCESTYILQSTRAAECVRTRDQVAAAAAAAVLLSPPHAVHARTRWAC